MHAGFSLGDGAVVYLNLRRLAENENALDDLAVSRHNDSLRHGVMV